MTSLKGQFNNYLMLKSPFLTYPLLSPPSRFITNDHKTPLRYIAPETDAPFIISFLKLKKSSQRHAPTHGTSTHVFKPINQIVRFK